MTSEGSSVRRIGGQRVPLRLWPVLAVATAAGCGDSPSEPVDLLGPWGGTGISLIVTETGGELVFDCAEGTLDGPLEAALDGSFEVAGTFVRGHGGPVRQDEEPEVLAARYSGEVQANLMTLSLSVVDSDLESGPFTLCKNAAALLRRCL